ncbi:diguanylate cyclase [Pseudobacteroides cellulosolvens ATCC 35603 = DSM 2933]|uniref:Diguanylate cyclase n=1 Tax=Pseudobacteroides cellulosolvens ATCC 35603 = DSM 2933 TaxID=398512 RepID=A0A0L6JKB6_9FIRM|nr:diguanylate cyclase [Pseudobacteroides cellulosolvens ATCC 35603 = DSM 2933]
MQFSIASVSLLIVVCLYGLKESAIAAIFVYGTSVVLGVTEQQSAVVSIAAITFIAWRMRIRHDGLITSTLLFWLLAGGPIMALLATITYGNINQIVVFHIQKEITIALLSCLLVDVLFTYSPLKRLGADGKVSIGFHFNRIMINTSLSAITIPYLLYMSIAGYNSTKRMEDLVHNTFVSQLQTIESYLHNQTENDLFALKQQGIVQVARLNQELQNIFADTGTEIVVTNYNNIVMASNSSVTIGGTFIWYMGDSIADRFANIYYWVPNKEFGSELEKWSYAYIIREKELPLLKLKTVMMTPFAPFLSNLLSAYIYQLWVYMLFCFAMLILSVLYNRIFFKLLEKLAETTTGIPTRLADGNGIEWYKSSIIEIDTLVNNFKTVTDNLEGMFHRTHHLAYYDSLTGLPNRLSMQDELIKMFGSQYAGRNLALMFFDLDRFK